MVGLALLILLKQYNIMTVHQIIVSNEDCDNEGFVKINLPFDIYTSHIDVTGYFVDALPQTAWDSNAYMNVDIPWLIAEVSTRDSWYNNNNTAHVLRIPVGWWTSNYTRHARSLDWVFKVKNSRIPKCFIMRLFNEYGEVYGWNTPPPHMAWKLILYFEADDKVLGGM